MGVQPRKTCGLYNKHTHTCGVMSKTRMNEIQEREKKTVSENSLVLYAIKMEWTGICFSRIQRATVEWHKISATN